MPSRRKSKKLRRHDRLIGPLNAFDLAQIVIAGIRIFQVIQAGAVKVETEPGKQIDNTETVEAEVISSEIKKPCSDPRT